MPLLTQTQLMHLPHVNALARAYYREPEANDIYIGDDQSHALSALAHAELRTGISPQEVNRRFALNPLLFLDAGFLVREMKERYRTGNPFAEVFRERVDAEIRAFLTHFVDGSYGKPNIEYPWSFA